MNKLRSTSTGRRVQVRTYVGAFILTFMLSTFMALATRDWNAYGMLILVFFVVITVDFTIWVCRKIK